MLVKVTTFVSFSLVTTLAQAQFSVPPDTRDSSNYPPYADPPPPATSFVRARVGPALRVTGAGSAGGLGTALDLGKYAGLRVSALWTQVGPLEDNAQYGADLWLNLTPGAVLAPIVAAGAGLVHQNPEPDAEAESNNPPNFGVATVRAGLEYAIDSNAADARLALEAMGSIPAIAAQDRAPWLTLTASLALGF